MNKIALICAMTQQVLFSQLTYLFFRVKIRIIREALHFRRKLQAVRIFFNFASDFAIQNILDIIDS